MPDILVRNRGKGNKGKQTRKALFFGQVIVLQEHSTRDGRAVLKMLMFKEHGQESKGGGWRSETKPFRQRQEENMADDTSNPDYPER